MKSELKVKFLQFLLGKKKDANEGFTLIELLVVVIIIGVLAAIALPNFLNQSAKAKQSEAKNTISSVNSAQTSYRQEKNSFGGDMDALALGLPTQTANYAYTIATTSNNLATINAATRDDALKGYSGATERYANANSESVVASVICEAKTPGTDATVPAANSVRPGAGSACPNDIELGQ